jgi:hypothetical protein
MRSEFNSRESVNSKPSYRPASALLSLLFANVHYNAHALQSR